MVKYGKSKERGVLNGKYVQPHCCSMPELREHLEGLKQIKPLRTMTLDNMKWPHICSNEEYPDVY